MLQTYTYPEYAYAQSEEQRTGTLKRHPLVIIGAGPIGLTQALDCALPRHTDRYSGRQQHRQHRLARRLLRQASAGDLGPPWRGREDFAARGVQWQVGKVFFRNDLAYPLRPAARGAITRCRP